MIFIPNLDVFIGDILVENEQKMKLQLNGKHIDEILKGNF
jgi:hypothetical protein